MASAIFNHCLHERMPETHTEISKVLGASLLMKIDIKELLNVPETLTQNQNVNELKLDF